MKIEFSQEERQRIESILEKYDPEKHPIIGRGIVDVTGKSAPRFIDIMRRRLRFNVEYLIALRGLAGWFEGHRVAWMKVVDKGVVESNWEDLTESAVRGEDELDTICRIAAASGEAMGRVVPDAFSNLCSAAEFAADDNPDKAEAAYGRSVEHAYRNLQPV